MNYSHGCCGTVVFTKKCGDHEIFITKIFNHGIFSNFTKILNHKNLELYGTVWRVIFVGANFHGKSEKALKINFRGFKFRDSNQSRGVAQLHKR